MRWTSKELRYLEEHACDGAKAISAELNRSVDSVKGQARRYGISLRRTWKCPKCGKASRSPLSPRTGWCAACTRAERNGRMAEEVRELNEEVRRVEEQRRESQRLYSAKHRARKKLKSMTLL